MSQAIIEDFEACQKYRVTAAREAPYPLPTMKRYPPNLDSIICSPQLLPIVRWAFMQ